MKKRSAHKVNLQDEAFKLPLPRLTRREGGGEFYNRYQEEKRLIINLEDE
jgi:hypothetical protein